MERDEKKTLSEELKALQDSIDALPSTGDEEQAQVLAALEELMGSLKQLTQTVESMKTETDE